MFDPKETQDTDDNILQEIIKMCETHMGGGLKKPDELNPPTEEGSPMEEASESPEQESAEGQPNLEDADLEELMRMYESAKG